MTARPLREAIRRHERLVMAAWLLVAGGVATFCILDAAVFGVSDRVIDAWSSRWESSLDHGEELLDGGDPREAAAYLARLEREFPARHVKHALGEEKERLLLLLSRAEEAAGRRRRAREALQRLVAFDPRNRANHFELAACLIRQGRGSEARIPLERCLEIDPAHRPALALLVMVGYEAADFDAVRRAWEAYADSPVMREVVVTGHGAERRAIIAADGRLHAVTLPLRRPAKGAVRVRVEPLGRPLAVVALRATPATVAGEITPSPLPALDFRIEAEHQRSDGKIVPARTEDTVTLHAAVTDVAIGAVTLELRLLVPVDAATWNTVERAYANLLATADLEEMRSRVVILEEGK